MVNCDINRKDFPLRALIRLKCKAQASWTNVASMHSPHLITFIVTLMKKATIKALFLEIDELTRQLILLCLLKSLLI